MISDMFFVGSPYVRRDVQGALHELVEEGVAVAVFHADAPRVCLNLLSTRPRGPVAHNKDGGRDWRREREAQGRREQVLGCNENGTPSSSLGDRWEHAQVQALSSASHHLHSSATIPQHRWAGGRGRHRRSMDHTTANNPPHVPTTPRPAPDSRLLRRCRRRTPRPLSPPRSRRPPTPPSCPRGRRQPPLRGRRRRPGGSGTAGC